MPSFDELHIIEPALPLDNLDRRLLIGDAILNFPARNSTTPGSGRGLDSIPNRGDPIYIETVEGRRFYPLRRCAFTETLFKGVFDRIVRLAGVIDEVDLQAVQQ